MPVRLNEYEPEVDLEPGTLKSAIVVFLYENPEFGYRPTEVGSQLDIEQRRAASILTNLHKRGYLGKTEDRHFHSLEKREHISSYVADLDTGYRMPGQSSDTERSSLTDRKGSDVKEMDEDELATEVKELEAELENDLN